ncbi:hypothetical protein ACXX9E_29745 [Pseudomonas sp. GNP014]
MTRDTWPMPCRHRIGSACAQYAAEFLVVQLNPEIIEAALLRGEFLHRIGDDHIVALFPMASASSPA